MSFDPDIHRTQSTMWLLLLGIWIHLSPVSLQRNVRPCQWVRICEIHFVFFTYHVHLLSCLDTFLVQPGKRQFKIYSMSFIILKKSLITALIIYHHCASSSSSSWSSGDPGEINQPLPLAASGRMLRTPPSLSSLPELGTLVLQALAAKTTQASDKPPVSRGLRGERGWIQGRYPTQEQRL